MVVLECARRRRAGHVEFEIKGHPKTFQKVGFLISDHGVQRGLDPKARCDRRATATASEYFAAMRIATAFEVRSSDDRQRSFHL
jgi:hypothetical protein